MAPLDGAFALAQVNDVPFAVAQHLNLHMAGLDDELLQIDVGPSEGRLGLAARRIELALEVFLALHHTHAASAASGRRFDHDGIADLGRHAQPFLHVLDHPVGAGHHGHPGLPHRLFGQAFVAHKPDGLGRGADELQPVIGADGAEIGIFRQKAVARMDGVGAGHFGGRDDAVDAQVAFGGRRRPDADRLVGKAHGERVAVGRRVDHDGLDAQFAAGADHPQRDFSSVGDQNLANHG